MKIAMAHKQFYIIVYSVHLCVKLRCLHLDTILDFFRALTMKNPYPALIGAVLVVVLLSDQETNAITETCLTRYQFHDHFMSSFLYEISVELFSKLDSSLHFSIALIELSLINIPAPPSARGSTFRVFMVT
jgi:hypothetical protein